MIEISYRLSSKNKALRIARAFKKEHEVVIHELDENDYQFLEDNYYFPENIEWLVSNGIRHLSSEDTKSLSDIVRYFHKDKETRRVERMLLYRQMLYV